MKPFRIGAAIANLILIFFFNSAFASGFSASESPSYDGEFYLNLPAEVWAPFSEYGGGSANITESYTLPSGGDSRSYTYTDIATGSTRYYLHNKSIGEYTYSFQVCGQNAEYGGGCSQQLITSVSVKSPVSEGEDSGGAWMGPEEFFDLTSFDIYYGDFNNDGVDGDIYFHGKDKFILIAGEINIPLLLDGQEGFVYYRNAEVQSYENPRRLTLTKEFLSSQLKAQLNYDYFEADLNGDGLIDLFVRGQKAGYPSLSVIQQSIGYPRTFVPSIDIDSAFDPSDRRNTIALIDYNLDGRADLVLLSSSDGYVMDVIYSSPTGRINETYTSVDTIDGMFDISTYNKNTVGVLGGSFRVSESGAATYDIPIFTPAGTAGVVPSVGLHYSSQSGNGIMGTGWSLSAYSVISRCRQTYNQDKKALPITWGSEDRFCLDGQRLILQSGTYGGAGSVYKTEIDSGAYIRAHGQVEGEPSYFSVIRKDGSITYFGFTASGVPDTKSKQEFATGKTMGWFQSRMEDNAGNPINYFYAHENGKNFRLVGISYAYGDVTLGGSAPAVNIEFKYEVRPDQMRGYLAGEVTGQIFRLKTIDVKNSVTYDANIRTYTISYNRDMRSEKIKRRSLVAAIQECVGSSCKVATRFDWNLVAGGISSQSDSELELSASNRYMKSFKPTDINGDGVLDLVWFYGYYDTGGDQDTQLHYALSVDGALQKKAFANGVDYVTFAEGFGQPISLNVLDFNADGRQDVAVLGSRDSDENTWKIFLSVPALIDGETDWRLSDEPIETFVRGDHKAIFADVNADGLTDIVSAQEVYFLTQRFDTPTELEYSSDRFYKYGAATQNPWSDIDVPFTSYYSEEHSVATTDESGNPYVIGTLSASASFRLHGVGDFNGDGRMDFVGGDYQRIRDHIDGSNETTIKEKLYVLFQTDAGLVNKKRLGYRERTEPGYTSDFEFETLIPLVGDINGDGLSDLLVREGNDIYFYASTGNGFLTKKHAVTVRDDDDLQLTDINNDGYMDLVAFRYVGTVGSLKVFYWDNVDETYVEYGGIPTFGDERSSHMFIDVNGDGANDYVRFRDNKLTTFLFESEYGSNEAINEIDMGFGAVTTIKYEPISNSDRYSRLTVAPEVVEEGMRCVSRTAPCKPYTLYAADDFYSALNKGLDSTLISPLRLSSPVLEFNGPFYVVTDATSIASATTLVNDTASLDGNAGTGSVESMAASVSYFYGEAKIQAGGSGFLGFNSLTTLDNQSGVRTTTVYRQDYPFIGSPLSTYVYSPDGSGLQSESHNVYAINNLPSNAEQIIESQGTSVLGSIIPYVQESVDINYANRSDVYTDVDSQLISAEEGDPQVCIASAEACQFYSNAASSQLILAQEVVTTGVDGYGNVTSLTTTNAGQGLQRQVISNHQYDSNKSLMIHGAALNYGVLGRLSSSTVTKSINNVAAPSNNTSFEYYEGGEAGGFPGMLKAELLSADDLVSGEDALAQHLTTSYSYDTFGNLRSKKVTGWDGIDIVDRESITEFDPSGRFVVATYNALGHELTKVTERDRYGTATAITSVNGATVTKITDSWGRETYAASNDGSWVSTEYVFCPNSQISCPSHAKTAVIKRTSVTALSTQIQAVTFLDSMGREVRTATLSFDGQYIYVDKEYDLLGRAVRISNPYFGSELGSSLAWTRQYFDSLGRPVLVYAPDGNEVRVVYEGLTTTTVNPLGQQKVETKNILGELERVEDHDGAAIVYSYTVEGHLSTVRSVEAGEPANDPYNYGVINDLCRQPQTNTEIVLCYDAWGRKTKMWDPDKGLWSYRYNAFGELLSQTNGNGQVTRNKYDKLGRIYERTDLNGSDTVEGVTSWYYDTHDDLNQPVVNAKTQPTAIVHSQSDSATVGEVSNHITRMQYDNLGRLVASRVVMPDGQEYKASTVYDSIGREEKSFNALNGLIIRDGSPIESGVKNHYNDFGYLFKTTNLEDNTTLYETKDYDAQNKLLEAVAGDTVTLKYGYYENTGLLSGKTATADGFTGQNIGYTWDAAGNLISRHNASGSLGANNDRKESFCYDKLNRLVKTFTGTLNPTCSLVETSRDLQYSSLGNIEYKRAVGTYRYGELSGGHRAGPHAVTSVTTTDNLVSRYYYDNNGNMVNGGGNLISYTTYDKASVIRNGKHTTKFRYNHSRSRYYREDITFNGSITKTWYLGSIEKVEKPNNIIEWKRSVAGGAIHTYTTNTTLVEVAAVKKQYILTDHLGSIDIIMDESGAVAQLMDFDAWGKRRDALTNSSFTVSQASAFDHSITTRGYTGHEMLDEVGIIHMNGRIYDPTLGRFLQADSLIDGTTDTQGFNRYGYVGNNPLAYSDPSGHFRLRDWVGTIVGVVAMVICQPCAVVGWQAIAVGAAAGAANALANRGNIYKGAVIGAMSSAAFSAVGSGTATGYSVGAGASKLAINAFSNGVVGGVFSVVSGGKFGHGFASAGLSAFAKPAIRGLGIGLRELPLRVAVRALMGGTISELTGGKFSNGAATAAFSQLFNEELALGAARDEQKEGARQETVKMAGMCESNNGSCEYRQKGIEDRPEGLTIGRKWCSYSCTVTYSSGNGEWSSPLNIEIVAPGEIGHSHSKIYSWNDKQAPRGTHEVPDPKYSSGIIKKIVINPFPVSTHFGPEHIVQPILEHINQNENSN